MRIDVVTVAAQIVNFLILIWLLRRFLYGPVMDAMRRREERIARSLQEARQLKTDAEEEGRTYREQRQELDRQREQLLSDARKAADEERSSRLEELQGEAEERRKQWIRQLETQRGEFLDQLRLHSVEYAVSLARQALLDLGDARLEEQIARVFVRQLEALEPEEQNKLAQSCKGAGMRMTLRTRFKLEPEDQSLLTKAVHETILDGAEVLYEHNPEFVCGLELSAGGQVLQWNVEGYLEELHQRMVEDLDESVATHGGNQR